VRGVARVAAWLALGAIAAALLADLLVGVRVTVLHRLKSPAEREAWRREVFAPGDDPAEIYGHPEPGTLRILLLDRARLLVPGEAPDRRLLFVDRAAGEAPLETKTLWAYAGAAAAGLLLTAALAWAASRGRRQRVPSGATPGE
jgi:hypothetical protein